MLLFRSAECGLKVTSLVLGLLTVIAIVPKSDAMLTNDRPLSIEQPAGNLHAQVIFQIGQPDTGTVGKHSDGVNLN